MEADFDPGPLMELKRDLDKDTVKEIIASYLNESPRLLDDAAKALQQRRIEDFRRAVHTLKSTSAHVGALRLSAACRTLEDAARDGQMPSEASGVQTLRTLYQAVLGRLQSWDG